MNPHLDTNAILVAVLYAAVTGVWNLALGHKSQVESWATSHPRLAAVLKMTRALGLDPWNFGAAIMLAFFKRLPQAQQSDSAIAVREFEKAEEKKAGKTDDTVNIGPVALLLLAAFATHSSACAAWKPTARTANDIAGELCTVFFHEQKPGLSISDVAHQFCTTQADLAPWLDQILSAKQSAGKVALSRKVAP